MNLSLKICSISETKHRTYPQRNESSWHRIAAVASLSAALLIGAPLSGQTPPEQRLAEAFRLEKEGQPAAAIAELQLLLDSKSLDRAGIGKAWDVLGLAFEDQGNFSASRRAYEQSIEAYEKLPDNTIDYAMTLDDFGELYVATGQLDSAVRMMEKARHLYEAANYHAGVVRSSGDLVGALLSQKKIPDARQNLDRAIKEARLTNDLDDDDLAAIASMQGWLAQYDGDLPASVSRYQQALNLLKKYHGEEHLSTGWSYVLLGDVRAETGDLTRSLAEMNTGLAILSRKLNSQDPRYLSAQLAYARALDKAGKHSEAAGIRTNAENQLKAYYRQCTNCTISAKAFQ
jgi:tetratricopeptide (TPR) repeat protein